MNKSFISAVTCGLLLSAFAAGAMADNTAAQPAGVSVRYGDLDLQSADGQRKLQQRLMQAARSLCPSETSSSLVVRLEGRKCVKEAVGRAKAGVSEQQVARTAAEQEKRG